MQKYYQPYPKKYVKYFLHKRLNEQSKTRIILNLLLFAKIGKLHLLFIAPIDVKNNEKVCCDMEINV